MSTHEVQPFQFNEMLHALREAELYRFPKDKVLLSAGCAGAWYFDWIEKACRPARHIGVELYSPKPASLPANCEWIVSSISAFPQVADRSVDIVFSGQNIEHLWPDDIVGFLLESRRVMRDDGLLAIDTPNRAVTSPMGWVQPEHTAEFTIAELTQMLALAGFAVETTVGHWLCQTDDGKPLSLIPDDERATEVVVAERVGRGHAQPDRAFSVWLNSRLAGTCDEDALRRFVEDTWQAANRERARRSTIAAGCSIDGETFSTNGAVSGFLMWGPYLPLLAGRYRATWRLRLDRPASGALANIDIVSAAGTRSEGRQIIDSGMLQPGVWKDFALDFDLDDTVFGLEFRLGSTATHALSARRYVVIEPR